MAGRDLIALAWRYGLVGLANTGVGLAVILAVEFGLKAPPVVANACGYGAGFALGYGLNRVFVFKSGDRVARTGPRYLLAVAVAYGLNLAVLQTLGSLLPPSAVSRAAVQVAAMGSYTLALFILSRYWVFADSRT